MDLISGRCSGSIFQQSSISCLIFGLHSSGIAGVKPSSRIFPPISKGSSLKCGSCWQTISQQTMPKDQTSVFSLYIGLLNDSGAYIRMIPLKIVNKNKIHPLNTIQRMGPNVAFVWECFWTCSTFLDRPKSCRNYSTNSLKDDLIRRMILPIFLALHETVKYF